MNRCLPVATGVLSTLSPQVDRMRSGLTPDMLATDLADYLVLKGVPFRETHRVAGLAVAAAEACGKPLSALTVKELRDLHPSFEEDVTRVWDFEHSVESRCSPGGTARAAVEYQIAELRNWQVCSTAALETALPDL